MEIKDAIEILHPDTTAEALRDYTREEAIKIVEEACMVACEVMEKQTPIKPMIKEKEYCASTYWCSCGKQQKRSKRWLKNQLSFCERCGQLLDWSND